MKNAILKTAAVCLLSMGMLAGLTSLRAQSYDKQYYKVTFFDTKKEDMSQQEFIDYMLETHIPLAAAIPGLKGYIVNFPKPELYGNDQEEPPYDAIAELWFEDEATFQASMESEEAQPALADANELFAEFPPMVVSEEIMMVYPDKPAWKDGYKATYLCMKQPDMEFEDMQLATMKHYIQRVIGLPDIQGYSYNFSATADSELPFHLMVHIWFDSKEAADKALKIAYGSSVMKQIREQTLSKMTGMEVQEYVVITPPTYRKHFAISN